MKIKKNRNKVCIIKNGTAFYNVYDMDAYIINHLLNYKILLPTKCGFPENSLNKVMKTLEENNISYEIIANNKKIQKDFLKNNYKTFYKMVLKNIDINEKLKIIISKLDELSLDELSNLLEVIDEYISK